MPVIWKFPVLNLAQFSSGFDGDITIPGAFRIVDVQMQGNIPTIWAEVNPANPKQKVRIIMVGTGHEIPMPAKHLGTVQDGELVWHIYQAGV